MGIIDVVVGGQFGSEGKGHVTQQIIRRHQDQDGPGSVLNVRVAGPNAGHTAYDKAGRKWPLRQIPVGVTVGSRLMIAPGSEVDPMVLREEVAALRDAELLHEGQLMIDPAVTLIDERHHRTEERNGSRYGTTGKGIGAARADRIMRQARLLGNDGGLLTWLSSAGVRVQPTGRCLREWVLSANSVVVEGTQGYGLGLHSGYYPFVTSSDCRALDFLAMAGLNPWWGGLGGSAEADWFRVWVVFRPYPIRIAGKSGPLKNETTWADLGLEPEITTVTKKTRRVGLWDPMLAASAVAANGGEPHVRAAFTMLDQVFPGIEGPNRWGSLAERTGGLDVHKWLAAKEEEIGCDVELVTISPTEAVWL